MVAGVGPRPSRGKEVAKRLRTRSRQHTSLEEGEGGGMVQGGGEAAEGRKQTKKEEEKKKVAENLVNLGLQAVGGGPTKSRKKQRGRWRWRWRGWSGCVDEGGGGSGRGWCGMREEEEEEEEEHFIVSRLFPRHLLPERNLPFRRHLVKRSCRGT